MVWQPKFPPAKIKRKSGRLLSWLKTRGSQKAQRTKKAKEKQKRLKLLGQKNWLKIIRRNRQWTNLVSKKCRLKENFRNSKTPYHWLSGFWVNLSGS